MENAQAFATYARCVRIAWLHANNARVSADLMGDLNGRCGQSGERIENDYSLSYSSCLPHGCGYGVCFMWSSPRGKLLTNVMGHIVRIWIETNIDLQYGTS